MEQRSSSGLAAGSDSGFPGDLGQEHDRPELIEVRWNGCRCPTGVGHRDGRGVELTGRIDDGAPRWDEPLLSFDPRARVQSDVGAAAARVEEPCGGAGVGRVFIVIAATRPESELEISMTVGSDTQHKAPHQRHPTHGDDHREDDCDGGRKARSMIQLRSSSPRPRYRGHAEQPQ